MVTIFYWWLGDWWQCKLGKCLWLSTVWLQQQTTRMIQLPIVSSSLDWPKMLMWSNYNTVSSLDDGSQPTTSLVMLDGIILFCVYKRTWWDTKTYWYYTTFCCCNKKKPEVLQTVCRYIHNNDWYIRGWLEQTYWKQTKVWELIYLRLCCHHSEVNIIM